ncbi:MAG: GC-type dockerin domain-anchored protein [Bdellovibrionota bacterium]|nr:MAG: GC-type dockerin domain-anchored protein [Bdellovibrionota bacterium]
MGSPSQPLRGVGHSISPLVHFLRRYSWHCGALVVLGVTQSVALAAPVQITPGNALDFYVADDPSAGLVCRKGDAGDIEVGKVRDLRFIVRGSARTQRARFKAKLREVRASNHPSKRRSAALRSRIRMLNECIRALSRGQIAPMEDPVRCADLNGDRVLDSNDHLEFLRRFFGGQPDADFNQDGRINSQDYFDFLSALERPELCDGVATPTPTPTATPDPDAPSQNQCNDGVDNDGDGAIDQSDAACGRGRDREDGFLTECQDGIDNDGEGRIDSADPSCHNPQVPYEVYPVAIGSVPDRFACDCASGADAGCIPGDDANAGTSAAAPVRTFERLRSMFGTLPAGSTVGFCRGGVFTVTGSDRWVNFNCREDDPCTIRDYTPPWASGDEGKPKVISPSRSAFAFEDGGNADHDEGYVLINLELQGAGIGFGVRAYNDADGIYISDMDIHGFDIGVALQGSNTLNPGADAISVRAVLRNSRITNNVTQGFFGGGHWALIEGNYFESNGTRYILDHNIYVSGGTGMKIIGNELYRSAMREGQCQGVSLVGHGNIANLTIEGNLIREDIGAAAQTCWGIAIDTGYASAESFPGLVIRGNTVLNVGNQSIGCTACSDAIIENNVVIQMQPFGGTQITAPNRAPGSSDAPTERVTIRNNSVYIGESGGTAVVNSAPGAVVANNAASIAAAASCGATALNNGVCHRRGAEGVDPQFMNPAAFDLRPASASSALVNSGNQELASIEDHSNLLRDSQPDVGAYEFIE